jgi:hypothetical protein
MNRSCPVRRRRRGTTLLEVVLGLVVLSTLLVSLAVARSRFTRQWSDADRRLRLIDAGDKLMAEWLAGPPEAVPKSGRGTLPGGGAWRTLRVPDAGAASLDSVVVRLELIEPGLTADRPVTIDFLLPQPKAVTR